jgi:hypothetical protein
MWGLGSSQGMLFNLPLGGQRHKQLHVPRNPQQPSAITPDSDDFTLIAALYNDGNE